MRVVIADDSVLIREGLARVLAEVGVETAASVGDARALEAAVAEHDPDVAIVDIRMPPTFVDEGVRAALRIRATHPRTAVLLLSAHVDVHAAMRLVGASSAAVGYLLKDRVADVHTLVDALARLAGGGTVLDPDLVGQLLRRQTHRDRLAALTTREREVLALIAEGRSNNAISRALFLNTKTVESHISNIFTKLDLLDLPDDNRRVLAVLAQLQG